MRTFWKRVEPAGCVCADSGAATPNNTAAVIDRTGAIRISLTPEWGAMMREQ
jgi:hypothetical protein